MFCRNGQRQRNSTLNLKDRLIDIETNLEDFPNISQQIKRVFKVGD